MGTQDSGRKTLQISDEAFWKLKMLIAYHHVSMREMFNVLLKGVFDATDLKDHGRVRQAFEARFIFDENRSFDTDDANMQTGEVEEISDIVDTQERTEVEPTTGKRQGRPTKRRTCVFCDTKYRLNPEHKSAAVCPDCKAKYEGAEDIDPRIFREGVVPISALESLPHRYRKTQPDSATDA